MLGLKHYEALCIREYYIMFTVCSLCSRGTDEQRWSGRMSAEFHSQRDT